MTSQFPKLLIILYHFHGSEHFHVLIYHDSRIIQEQNTELQTHTHNHLTAFFPGQPG